MSERMSFMLKKKKGEMGTVNERCRKIEVNNGEGNPILRNNVLVDRSIDKYKSLLIRQQYRL